MPLFIAFEGGEASGKTTQARLLRDRLRRRGYGVVLLREPGSTALGEGLRRWLKSGRVSSPWAEALLFAAARAEMVALRARPALEAGRFVLCDRYADSTLAYQGYGRGLDLEALRRINRLATGGLAPHLTVLLDLPVEEWARRRRPSPEDRFDREGLEFHRRVRQGYLELARQEPRRWLVVDARLPARQIARLVWERVEGLLRQGGHTL